MTLYPEQAPRGAGLPVEPTPDPGRAYAEIYPLIAERMDEVERTYASWLGSNVEIVGTIGSYLSESGGKRLRPALLLLCSGLAGYRGPWDVVFGAVFECIHTATLVHDDIIDEAETRRGRASLNRLWGNDLSVLIGDHLYLKAMKMALQAGDLRILNLLADVTLRMIEGELIQKNVNGRLDMGEDQYLEIIERKTALLFSACCEVPGILARLSPDRQAALSRYGRSLGMAFQIVDDLLDLTADEKKLGKPVGGDLREGKLTLPLILLLARGGSGHRDLVSGIVEGGVFPEAAREQVLAALVETGVLRATRQIAQTHAEAARGELRVFAPGPFRNALDAIPSFVLARDR